MIIKFVFSIMISFGATAEVRDPVYDELTGLDLVEALIRDGKVDLAEKELVNFPRAWMALGHLAFAKEDYKLAVESYLKAPASERRSLELARTYYRQNNWTNCYKSYSGSGEDWLVKDEDVIAKSKCNSQSERWSEALKDLEMESRKMHRFHLSES